MRALRLGLRCPNTLRYEDGQSGIASCGVWLGWSFGRTRCTTRGLYPVRSLTRGVVVAAPDLAKFRKFGRDLSAQEGFLDRRRAIKAIDGTPICRRVTMLWTWVNVHGVQRFDAARRVGRICLE
jgi:hypothetical protein